MLENTPIPGCGSRILKREGSGIFNCTNLFRDHYESTYSDFQDSDVHPPPLDVYPEATV